MLQNCWSNYTGNIIKEALSQIYLLQTRREDTEHDARAGSMCTKHDFVRVPVYLDGKVFKDTVNCK